MKFKLVLLTYEGNGKYAQKPLGLHNEKDLLSNMKEIAETMFGEDCRILETASLVGRYYYSQKTGDCIGTQEEMS